MHPDTLWVDGVEYNEYPPPPRLIKAMNGGWAERLVSDGLLRFRSLEYYRRWEKEQLGDPNEGLGLFHYNGLPMTTETTLDVHIQCFSLEREAAAALAQEADYDCLAVIHSSENLLIRVRNWLSRDRRHPILHCGRVIYNRGEEVDKETLNSQKWHSNIFQKDTSFCGQVEYRLAITYYDNDPLDEPDLEKPSPAESSLEESYLDVQLGDCREFITIEPFATPVLRFLPAV
jgi:hypothetical protein